MDPESLSGRGSCLAACDRGVPDRQCPRVSSPIGIGVRASRAAASLAVVLCGMCLGVGTRSGLAAQAHCATGGVTATSCVPTSFGKGQLSLVAGERRSAGSGLAINQTTGDIYVADTGNHRIVEFSSVGSFVRSWGWGVLSGSPESQVCTALPCLQGLSGSAPGQFETPTFLAVDQTNGDVYVGDIGDQRLSKFTATGELVTQWGDGGAGGSANGQLVGTEAHGLFGSPAGIAVDASGNLWVFVAGTVEAVGVHMYEFTASGAFVQTWVPEHVGASGYSPQGIAVDSVGDLYVSENSEQIQKLTPSGSWQGALYSNAAVSGLTLDMSRSELYADEAGTSIIDLSSQCEPSLTPGSSCSLISGFGTGALAGAAGLAINPNSGTTYVANTEADEITEFPVTIEANVGPASAVTTNAAQPNGEVNPKGREIAECGFQYGETKSYGKTAPCAPSAIGSGTSPVAVHADVSALTGGHTYHYRLRVINSAGEEVFSEDQPFSTTTTAVIEEVATSEIGPTSALVTAKINPKGLSTTCVIEYGTSLSYGTTLPCEPAALGSGTSGVLISGHLTGLTPDVTYHWRVVASDVNGSIPATVEGPDSTFVFLSTIPDLEHGCSNQGLREEGVVSPKTDRPVSADLPDCRGLEMVSPPQKNAALLAPVIFGLLPAVADDGSRVIASTVQCFAAAPSCTGDRVSKGPPFEFARTSQGWATTSLAPSASLFEINSVWGYNADTDMVLYSAPVASHATDKFYARQPGGAFTEIGPIAESRPFTTIASSQLVTSADLSHVVYESNSESLWTFDEGERNSLYEYSGVGGTSPLLVGVSGGNASTDLISTCGTALGSLSGGFDSEALSGDGRVYFSAAACPQGSGSNGAKAVPATDVYARVDGDTAQAHTVEISESQCGTGGQPDEVECRADETHLADAFFEGASETGSAVFTSTQKLTDEASQDSRSSDSANPARCAKTTGRNGCNLYLYDAGAPTGQNLIDVSRGDTSGLGPQVQGTMAVSSDGSHVYYVARGVLSTHANSRGQSPTEGANNLYDYDRSSVDPANANTFIATLPGNTEGSPAETSEWGGGPIANVSPTGRYMVFTSHGPLVPGDTSGGGSAQVYRYDAQSGDLERVSFGQRGFNNNGSGGSGQARIVVPGGLVGPQRRDPTMSDDGSYVFFQSPVGLTPAALNDVSVNGQVGDLAENVYEWAAPGKGGCAQPEGCVFLISDGRDATEGNNGGGRTTLSSVELIGADASGENVFFTTADPLVLADTDSQLDIYDARIGGGFTQASSPASCLHDEKCPAQGSEPFVPGLLGSSNPSGLGNVGAGDVGTQPKKPAAKPLTRAQKLAKALKLCHAKRNRHRRANCERAARKKYGAKKARSGARRGGKNESAGRHK
jgi:sugar lactone lactonase YvrE